MPYYELMTFTAYVLGTEQANGHSVIPAWAKPNFDSSGTLPEGNHPQR